MSEDQNFVENETKNYTDYTDEKVRNAPLRLTDANVNSKEFLGLFEVVKMESPCMVLFYNKFPSETFLNMFKNVIRIEPNNTPKEEYSITIYMVSLSNLRNGEIAKVGKIKHDLHTYFVLTELVKGQALGVVERLADNTTRLLDYNNYITEMEL